MGLSRSSDAEDDRATPQERKEEAPRNVASYLLTLFAAWLVLAPLFFVAWIVRLGLKLIWYAIVAVVVVGALILVFG